MQIGLAAAFLGGVLALLSPCSALLLPSFFAYAFTTRTRLLGRTALFFLGLVAMLLPIGVFAGSLGGLVLTYRSLIVTIAAVLIILFGALHLAGLRVRWPRMQHRGGTGVLSVFLLGVAFGLAGTCSGPVLGAILTIAALGGNAAYGGLLLTVYAVGMVVPVFVLALLWDAFDLGNRRWLKPRTIRIGPWQSTVVEVLSGLFMIAVGVLLLVTDGTAGLDGILGVRQQYEVELWAQSTGLRLGDVTFVVLGAMLAAVGFLWWWTLSRRRAAARHE
ncbi:cytochrome c biogenesis CcdA family protein [Glaciibacter psychrotolerans]|uniref:Cytochrome c biogenesis protein CcdA n=1 Tax=Glaciibacter psychrotolerans TaxID=670054 RepID=A0A7Z0J5B6_9MICO|nr:cytochrome c biogenesis CcdA family protein [Leifsonia psychrotolerans]NYJ18743.1 cytochrome c biogenesis protein CcdA [Leifsonia psychrotolerans]